MVDFLKLENFQILKDETLGELFFPEGLCFYADKSFVPTINHGRSIAVKVDDFEWILVKGGGWNYGGPSVYISKKDDELVFGLNPLKACIREYEVSKALEKISEDFPKVLYYKRFADYNLPEKYDFLKSVCYSNGELVDPALLYTRVKFPYRVADLMYLSDQEKNAVITECCKYWNIANASYIDIFSKKLAYSVAIMHCNGFMNDTFEFSNVTLLAEIVDYELVTAPGVTLCEGLYDNWRVEERKEKELLYGAEIIFQLCNFLHIKSSLYQCYDLFVSEYRRINPEFINSNSRILNILNKKEFIV